MDGTKQSDNNGRLTNAPRATITFIVPDASGAGIGVPNLTGAQRHPSRRFFMPATPQWRAVRRSLRAGRFPVGRYANAVQSVSNLIGVRRDGSKISHWSHP